VQIVHFECPDPPKGGFWSYEEAWKALPVSREKFYRLIDAGVFPKGQKRHNPKTKKPQYRFTRKHMAKMLDYLENENDYNPPPGTGEPPAE
jgi:hypothetical protein